MRHPHNITASETRIDGRPANPYAGIVRLRRVPSVIPLCVFVGVLAATVAYAVCVIAYG